MRRASIETVDQVSVRTVSFPKPGGVWGLKDNISVLLIQRALSTLEISRR